MVSGESEEVKKPNASRRDEERSVKKSGTNSGRKYQGMGIGS